MFLDLFLALADEWFKNETCRIQLVSGDYSGVML